MDVMELCGCETFVSSSRLRYKYNIINYYTLTDNSKLYIYLFIQCWFGVLKNSKQWWCMHVLSVGEGVHLQCSTRDRWTLWWWRWLRRWHKPKHKCCYWSLGTAACLWKHNACCWNTLRMEWQSWGEWKAWIDWTLAAESRNWSFCSLQYFMVSCLKHNNITVSLVQKYMIIMHQRNVRQQ